MERGHLHGSHDDLEAGVVLDEEAHAVVEPHRGRRVQRRLAVQLHVVRLSPVIYCMIKREGESLDIWKSVTNTLEANGPQGPRLYGGQLRLRLHGWAGPRLGEFFQSS